MEQSGANAPYSVCIVNHEGAAVLPATLAAVRALAPPPAEVVLVDNASGDDGVALALATMPALRVVRLPSNDGPGPARDAGYRAARQDRILFIDNDVRPDPGCGAALSCALDAQPAAAFAMARICHAHAPGTIQFDGAGAHALGMMTLDRAETPLASAAGEVREIGSLVTACFMADRQRWGQEPLCDPAFFIYFEDHELGLRARLLGWRLLAVPQALALHGKGTPGMSLRATGRFTRTRIYYTIRNRWQVILKFYQPRTLAALAPALLLFELFQLAGALRRGWLGHYWQAAGWIVANRRDLGERRRQIQGRRKLPDTAILSGGPPPFAGPLLTGGIERAAAHLLARTVDVNWALASRLLVAAAR